MTPITTAILSHNLALVSAVILAGYLALLTAVNPSHNLAIVTAVILGHNLALVTVDKYHQYMGHYRRKLDIYHFLLGGHSRSRSFRHESEALAAFHKKENEVQCR